MLKDAWELYEKSAQTITFAEMSSKPYTDADFGSLHLLLPKSVAVYRIKAKNMQYKF